MVQLCDPGIGHVDGFGQSGATRSVKNHDMLEATFITLAFEVTLLLSESHHLVKCGDLVTMQIFRVILKDAQMGLDTFGEEVVGRVCALQKVDLGLVGVSKGKKKSLFEVLLASSKLQGSMINGRG